MKPIFKRLLSGVLSATMTISAIPVVSARAEESTEPYPYTMFAASNDNGAITINAENFCVNGSVATNGTIVSSGNMNINGTIDESADESMIFIFDKIDNKYFSNPNVEMHDEDYTLEELNININVPTEVQGKATLTGNININNALKVLEDVTLYGEVKNANNSLIFSKYGDIVIDSQNVNLNGLVYAPFGTVNITAQNLNLNNSVIIADNIIINCPNANANNSSNVSSFVGLESEDISLIDIDKAKLIHREDGAYEASGGFKGLCGYLGFAKKADSLSCEVYDKNDTLIYSSTIAPSVTWSFNEIGLINGYNKVVLNATYKNGDICEKTIVIYPNSSYFMNFINVDMNDDDGDGLWNYFEGYFGADKLIADTDGDGLSDYIEVYKIGTDPTNIDTDSNGVLDCDEDADKDGVNNLRELEIGSSLIDIDTDGDMLEDGIELSIGTSLLIVDTDEDEISDYDEYILALDPLSYDNCNEITKVFSAEDYCDGYDRNVIPSIKLTSSVHGINTFQMNVVEDNIMLGPSIEGYLGCAYDFKSDETFISAELTFTYNPFVLEELTEQERNEFVPAIYYYNEEKGVLEEVQTQTWEGNSVTAKLEHFSIYMLINKTSLLNFRNREITYPDNTDIQKINHHIMFLLDTSGSMTGNDPNYIRASLVKQFAEKVDERVKIGIMSFDSSTTLYTKSGVTNNVKEIDDAIDQFIEYGNPGLTYISQALHDARDELLKIQDEADGVTNKTIFLLTDGVSSDTPSSEFLDELQKAGIKVCTVGLGNVSEEYLRRIANGTVKDHNGSYYYAAIDTELSEVYLNFEHDVIFTDENDDKIDDYYAYLLCRGEITTYDGVPILAGVDYDKFQSNNDWDEDRLLNGEEISIFFMGNKPYVSIQSDPRLLDTDFDYTSDYEEIKIHKTDPKKKDSVIYDDDYSYITTEGNFECTYAASMYRDSNKGLMCLERIGDVVLAGGEISFTRMYYNKLLDYLRLCAGNKGQDQLDLELMDTVYNALCFESLNLTYYCKYSESAKEAQKAFEEYNRMQKQFKAFRKEPQKFLENGNDILHKMRVEKHAINKNYKSITKKLQKPGETESKISKCALVVYVGTATIEEISYFSCLNANLKLITGYKDLVGKLRLDGSILELQNAAKDLYKSLSKQEAEATKLNVVTKVGEDALVITGNILFHNNLIKLSSYGLTLEVVLIIGGVFVGDNLGIRLDNAITVDMADSIVSICETEIEQKCSRGTSLYGSELYVLKSEDAPMYFYCAACARLWSEQNYYNFLDGNFWNGLLYERWHGYENSLANLIKIRKVLARCE